MGKEENLQSIATRLRIHALKMTTKAGSGHPTTCMSMAELMACLFFDEMRYDVKNPNNPNNDEFVLSKGHASPILWACFAEAGIVPMKKLETYRQFNSPLEGHPTPNMPWIKAATGSLGQGLSIGVGMAAAMKLSKVDSRVYVMLGDGECAEGSVWEAAALAKNLNLSNLVAVVDCNRLAQSGESLHGHDIKRWRLKWSGFGWNVFTVDGHDVKHILNALSLAQGMNGPCVILAKTLKGKGVSFVEDKMGWHGKTLSPDMLKKALKELGPMPDAKKLVKKPSKSKPEKLKVRVPAGPSYKLKDVVATREAYGNMLSKMCGDEHVVGLDGDVKNSTFSERFKDRCPSHFFDCFIAEQNMVGMAVGLAAKGFVPFASTFGTFFTRAHDQIRMAAISRANIKLSGSHVGISIGADGPSQMGLEDIGMMRCLPGSVVLYPCDAVSGERCTELLATHQGIGYIRTSRPKTPVLYKNAEKFEIGGSKVLRKSSSDKVVVIAAGVTVHETLKAVDDLKESVRVIDAYSIKPLDEKTIKSAAKNRKVIVVEDHYPEGGLGEAVAALGIPITHLAVRGIPRSGKPEELLKAFKIDSSAIKKAIKR